MRTPLNASATTAGTLMSSTTFEVPRYQREYAWEEDEVTDFWNDIKKSLNEDSYFLGLLILTEKDERKHVVDGQQRILTLTLLAAALYHEAVHSGRKALAEKIHSDFISSIDYATDESHPRVILSDAKDNETLQHLIKKGQIKALSENDENGVSVTLNKAFDILQKKLKFELAEDPFKKLGLWSDFITNRLYFAVFVHPNAASAYRVYEVINTRGKELTTADLLKNYAISQTSPANQQALYDKWQKIARSFPPSSSSSLVQYIRHIVTVQAGYILPKDLFDFIASRQTFGAKQAPSIPELMNLLEESLPLYLQMTDPSLDGPAENEWLGIFAALNSLSVISVRPLLLAIAGTNDAISGMRYVLRLVVRRTIAGNLGTGNVERQLSDAAREIKVKNNWQVAIDLLRHLDPDDDQFVSQIYKRSFNKDVLTFLRRSAIQKTITPEHIGTLHFIAPRNTTSWEGLNAQDMKFWSGTIGNTFLSTEEKRPKAANSWEGVKTVLLTTAVSGELAKELGYLDAWTAEAVEAIGRQISEITRVVWQ